MSTSLAFTLCEEKDFATCDRLPSGMSILPALPVAPVAPLDSSLLWLCSFVLSAPWVSSVCFCMLSELFFLVSALFSEVFFLVSELFSELFFLVSELFSMLSELFC